MKKAFLFLTLAGCFALPAFSRAGEPATTKSSRKTAPSKVAAQTKTAAPKQERVIYYITSEPRTGSLIPMTYRRYNGRIDSASNAAVYGSSQIDITGQLDLGTVLTKLDPSISLRRGR